MKTVLLDPLRQKYKLPSRVEVPTTTPFPLKRRKGVTVPGSSSNCTSLFSSIPDMPALAKAALSLPETKVKTNILKDYTKQPQPTDLKSRLDGKN